MGMNTAIQWCIHTLNLWWGCVEVHSGCDHCYARVFARSKGKGNGWDGVRYAVGSAWSNVMKWQAAAAKAGEVHRVFTGSMMDIFEKDRPVADWSGKPTGDWLATLRSRYFNEVIPSTPNLLHLLLTKRPGNIEKMVPACWLDPGGWPRNVMTGTSPVDQATADTLIPQLLAVPGPHFLSMEPMLGPVNLSRWLATRCPRCDSPSPELHPAVQFEGEVETCRHPYHRLPRCQPRTLIGWVIVGGESGPKARPFDLAWARSIRDQCRAAGVAYFCKQLGACPVETPVPGYTTGLPKLRDSHGGDWSEWPDDLKVRQFPEPAGIS